MPSLERVAIELLAPVVVKLSRALKRALQDDQNELLNALRHASGAPELDVLLPEEAQSERYTRAAAGGTWRRLAPRAELAPA